MMQTVKMSKLDSRGLLHLALESMEAHASNPGRDKYCCGFDKVYEQRKAEYFKMTGNEWGKGRCT